MKINMYKQHDLDVLIHTNEATVEATDKKYIYFTRKKNVDIFNTETLIQMYLFGLSKLSTPT